MTFAVLADKSDPAVEPGTITTFKFGEHFSRISAFQIDDDLSTNFCLAVSLFIFGSFKTKFESLELKQNSSNKDIDVWYFRILENSKEMW